MRGLLSGQLGYKKWEDFQEQVRFRFLMGVYAKEIKDILFLFLFFYFELEVCHLVSVL